MTDMHLPGAAGVPAAEPTAQAVPSPVAPDHIPPAGRSRTRAVRAHTLAPAGRTAHIEVLTLHEAAAALRVSAQTVLRQIARGRLRGCKVGGQWRFTWAQIEAALAACEVNRARPEPENVMEIGFSRGAMAELERRRK
jgi:excisionase family DNA binding protein